VVRSKGEEFRNRETALKKGLMRNQREDKILARLKGEKRKGTTTHKEGRGGGVLVAIRRHSQNSTRRNLLGNCEPGRPQSVRGASEKKIVDVRRSAPKESPGVAG